MTEIKHNHNHYHSPEEKKKQLNRLSKAIGHLQHVKVMMENDEDCADVLMQLTAVNAALKKPGQGDHKRAHDHCIVHAIEDGDMKEVEEFPGGHQKKIHISIIPSPLVGGGIFLYNCANKSRI